MTPLRTLTSLTARFCRAGDYSPEAGDARRTLQAAVNAALSEGRDIGAVRQAVRRGVSVRQADVGAVLAALGLGPK
jgi:hypothetical protein